VRNKLDGGEAILEGIRQLGVEYILSSPGTEWASIWEAMANQVEQGRNGPVFMDCWHETLAVDIAAGYTLATGKMQAVLLHAGAGLLQGAMGIHGAFLAGVPMLVISGESLTYGEEPGFDPGMQWIHNLSIVGGPQRLVEPIVKYATQSASPHTIYQSVIRAGEIAQRTPQGPAYLSVPTETMLDEWTPPSYGTLVPSAPKVFTPAADVRRLAEKLVSAKRPVIITEAAGRETETYDALLALAETMSLPVLETPVALFANFPKDHALYQGSDLKPFWDEMDLAIVIRARVPWYPPHNRPPKAAIAILDEAPHRMDMAYQSHHADMYLEGDVAQTLRDLTAEVRDIGIDNEAAEARRKALAESHDRLWAGRETAQREARKKSPIDAVWLCAALNEVMPEGVVYVDEVTSHTPLLRQHLRWNRPQSLFKKQGGLGQGLGLALGVKLAKPDRPVVALIGDGAFLYNPVLQSLGASRDFKLPITAIIFDNRKYANMQATHRKMYPGGVAEQTDIQYGTHINAPDYVQVVGGCGCYGERVEDPEKLPQALRNALDANDRGTTAVIDVVLG